MANNKETSAMSLRSRFKNFWTSQKPQSTPPAINNKQEDSYIADDFWLSIAHSSPVEHRIEKLKTLKNVFETKLLESGFLEKLWMESKDLLNPVHPDNTRVEYFSFLQHLVASQYRRLGMLKAALYDELILQNYTACDDILHVMLIVDALSDHGKHLQFLEHDIAYQLVMWMKLLGGNEVFLSLLLNVMKFNSSLLEGKAMEELVRHLCHHCVQIAQDKSLECLLKVLDAIICYNSLPHHCLYEVVVTLCTALNRQNLSDQSWKIMRNLLGTHLGHSCVQTMCKLLEKEGSVSSSILRSAVFYLGMGLWGSKCVTSLTHKPQSILPFFQFALESSDPLVGLEVSLTCQRLVKKFGHDLHVSAWDSILTIVPLLLEMALAGGKSEPYRSLRTSSHDLLTLIERLHQIHAFDGSAEQLFTVVEMCGDDRPTDSLLLLLAHKAERIDPTDEKWMTCLLQLMVKFFAVDMKIEIRLKALDIFSTLVLQHFHASEKDLINTLIVPVLQQVNTEPTHEVRTRAIDLLVTLAIQSKTKTFHSLLQCLKPVVFAALEPALSVDVTQLANEANKCSSVDAILSGLRQIFCEKFDTDQFYHCAETFDVLVGFAKMYYEKSYLTQPDYLWEARKETLMLFTRLRASSAFQLKLLGTERYSPRIMCSDEAAVPSETDTIGESISTKRPETTRIVLPFKEAFACFVLCFEKERYWPVLESLLQDISGTLDNKSIVYSVERSDVRNLTDATSSLISSSVRPTTLVGTWDGFKREDLQSRALAALTRLSFYHGHLDVPRQRQILRCIESGFTSRCAKQCISAITLCIVEMSSDSLLRVLPSILLHLSQMSATVRLATAVLELLSTLSQLPSLYANFVEDQYMSVFAVALEHATPAKFSFYVVSLAHHVVYTWFVKCRLAFRPDFVQFITRKLQNVNRNCMDNPFQHNLVESSIDVMARYTFSNSMPLASNPSRRPGDRKPRQTATWLLGNRLITISTDGGLSSVSRSASNGGGNGSDSKALDSSPVHSFERRMSVEAPAKLQSSNENSPGAIRARHKSGGGALRSRGRLVGEDAPKSGDDVLPLAKQSAYVTDEESFGAEICIRRPSGNTTFVLSSQQLRLLTLTEDSSSTGGRTTNLALLKAASVDDGSVTDDVYDSGNSSSNGEQATFFRQRSHTVSSSQDYAQSAAQRAASKAKQRSQKVTVGQLLDEPRSDAYLADAAAKTEDSRLSPGFIFLQLFQTAAIADSIHTPIHLPDSVAIDRAVQVLDMIPPYDTWATGVVYVRPGQTNDAHAILSNEHGSPRYHTFLGSLGRLVALTECDRSHTYLGGLDQTGEEDGLFTYVWQENIMQMVFHVTTLMPNRGSEISCKQRHIGNDYVTIVYDDNETSGYQPGSVVRGQFLSAEIIVNPLDQGFHSVRIAYHKPDMEEILQISEKRTVSDARLGVLVRQMALHANMAAVACRHQNKAEESVSKPLARLKQIKRLRSKVAQEMAGKHNLGGEARKAHKEPGLYPLEEFSDYV